MPQPQSDLFTSRIESGLHLTISIVTFRPNLHELHKTLESLVQSLASFDPKLVALTLIDNSDEDLISPLLGEILKGWNYSLIHGQGNIGFGSAHNLALQRIGTYHLILNPDIEMAPNALHEAYDFMQRNPECALLSPHATWPNGQRQYLCKRFPAAWDLLIRGFAPSFVRKLFETRINRYEMRDETQNMVFWNPPIVSGCFMLFRSSTLKELNGFDSDYFLYFEDFDLSLRCNKITKTAYVPSVKIVHAGGNASHKGSWHIRQFMISAARFYKKHGLKIL